MPVDLAAVQADDALLDLIGRAGHIPGDADEELTRILSAWRREVHAEPFQELVDTNRALEVIHSACQPVRRRRRPVPGSIAAAAAVLVIAFSSVGLVAKAAQPGDPLWGVTQVLYRDYARSVETAAVVRTELNDARTALKEGNPDRARASLQRVQTQLPTIGEDEGRTDLTARHRQLEQMLNGSPSAGSANLPGVPMFPPSGAAEARRDPSVPPKSNTPLTPAGSNANSDSDSNINSGLPTEAPSNTTSGRPNRIGPNRIGSNRIGPGRQQPDHGYPGPGGASADSGPSDSGPSGIGPSDSGPASSGTSSGFTAGGSAAGRSAAGGSFPGAASTPGGASTGGPNIPGGGTSIPGAGPSIPGGSPVVNHSLNNNPAGSVVPQSGQVGIIPPSVPVPPSAPAAPSLPVPPR
jgi:hypothetical protein